MQAIAWLLDLCEVSQQLLAQQLSNGSVGRDNGELAQTENAAQVSIYVYFFTESFLRFQLCINTHSRFIIVDLVNVGVIRLR